MEYVLIKSDRKGVLGVLASGSKDRLQELKDTIMTRNSNRRYSVNYKLEIWKVKNNV